MLPESERQARRSRAEQPLEDKRMQLAIAADAIKGLPEYAKIWGSLQRDVNNLTRTIRDSTEAGRRAVDATMLRDHQDVLAQQEEAKKEDQARQREQNQKRRLAQELDRSRARTRGKVEGPVPEVGPPLPPPPGAPPLPDGPLAGVYSVREALKEEMMLVQSFDSDKYRLRLWGKFFGAVMPQRDDIPITPQNIRETQEAVSIFADRYFKGEATRLQDLKRKGFKRFDLVWWPSKYKAKYDKRKVLKKCDLGDPLIENSNTLMCGFMKYIRSDLTDVEIHRWIEVLLKDFEKSQSKLGD